MNFSQGKRKRAFSFSLLYLLSTYISLLSITTSSPSPSFSSPTFAVSFFSSFSFSFSLYERPKQRERRAMKNTIRCCISCILPCGALDVIRIVHSNGRVEEITGTIKASDIMKAHPKHVLKKPSSPSDDGMVPQIVVVPPEAELQRGKIYFLMPVPSTPQKTRSKSSSTTTTTKKKRRDNPHDSNHGNHNKNNSYGHSHSHSRQHRHSRSMSNASKNHSNNNNSISMTNLLISDQYLSEILSEKSTTQRDRRRGRVGVWRPHLESISETTCEA